MLNLKAKFKGYLRELGFIDDINIKKLRTQKEGGNPYRCLIYDQRVLKRLGVNQKNEQPEQHEQQIDE